MTLVFHLFFGLSYDDRALHENGATSDERTGNMDELVSASATFLAQAIREKRVSSQEVVEAYIHRIGAVNPQLNAIVQLTADSTLIQAKQADAALARGEIKGPLHGVPITVKDSFETAGIISTAGTKGRASYVPLQDTT